MKSYSKHLILAIGALLPVAAFAQATAAQTDSLQEILDDVYRDTLPLCSELIDVGRGLAAFAAIWYIGSRVWRSIASAEPIDFYPLLRPFVIALAIAMFPQVIGLMNDVLQPTVRGTEAMIEQSNKTVEVLLKRKEEAIKQTQLHAFYEQDHAFFEEYVVPGATEATYDPLGINFQINKALYKFKNSIKQALAEVLQVVFEAVGLAINLVRVFYLIVLAIIGPLVFGLAVFDGFQNSLIAWFGRYINVFLWYPVANILSAILGRFQEAMIKLDIAQIELHGNTTFGLNDTAYLIFLIVGIVGYAFVPAIANYIVHAGDNRHVSRATSFFYASGKAMVQGGYKYMSGGSQKSKSDSQWRSDGGSIGSSLVPPSASHHATPSGQAGSSGGHSSAGSVGRDENAHWQRDRLGKS